MPKNRRAGHFESIACLLLNSFPAFFPLQWALGSSSLMLRLCSLFQLLPLLQSHSIFQLLPLSLFQLLPLLRSHSLFQLLPLLRSILFASMSLRLLVRSAVQRLLESLVRVH